MKVYMIERSDRCMGENESWIVGGLYFSTPEKAWEWIRKNPCSYTQQDVIEEDIKVR